MHDQHLPEQAVAVEIAADATEPPINLIAKMKAAIADLSARQILKLIFLGLALIVWYPIYSRLVPFSLWVTYDVFRIAHGTHLGDAVSFFFLDIPKVFMLLILVIWGVGVLRSFFTPERTRTILAGKREISRRCAGGALGGGDALLLLFGGAALYRLCRSGHSHRRHLRLLDLGPHGERDRPGAALRPLRLAHRPDLYVHGLAHRHRPPA